MLAGYHWWFLTATSRDSPSDMPSKYQFTVSYFRFEVLG